MEEMNLVIAVDVPYEVEITAKGIPMHESKVEFCLAKNDVSYNFPAKMIDDKKFVFTLTNILKNLTNETHNYKLYVYYGNARFEADSGSFNLVDKKAFDIKMSSDKTTKSEKSLSERLTGKVAKRTIVESVKTEVTPTTEGVKGDNTETKVAATKPTPTPTIEPTTTLKEAKDALVKVKGKDTPVSEGPSGEQKDANEKIRRILSGIDKSTMTEVYATPTVEITSTQEKPNFFKEIDEMKKINERRKKNKVIKDAIKKTNKKD